MAFDDDRTVEIRITAKNLTKGEFAAVRQEIAGLSREQGKLYDSSGRLIPIQQKVADAQHTLNAAHKTGASVTKGFEGAIGSLGRQMGLSEGMAGKLAGVVTRFAGPLAIGLAIKQSIDWADSLVKLSDRTGLSVSALQKFEFVGTQTGVTVEDVTGAVTNLQKQIGAKDEGLVKALGQLGLNFETIQRLSPEDQFAAISTALRNIENPAQRITLATEIFGRQAATVMPLIRADFQKLANQAPVMSDAAVEALDKTGDAIDALWLRTKHAIAETAGLTIAAVMRGGTLASRDPVLRQLQEQGLKEKLPAAPGARIPLMGREAIDPSLIGSLQLGGQTLAQQMEAADKRIDAEKKARDKAEKDRDELERMFARDREQVWRGTGMELPGALRERFGPGEMPTPLFGAERVGTIADIQRLLSDRAVMPGAPLNRLSFARDLTTGVPDAIMAAITGGGSKLQAAGSAVGMSLFGQGSKLTGMIGGGISKLFGTGGLGKMMGDMVPMIGSMIGPAIQGIMRLFGGSEQSRVVNPARDKFFADMGGLDALNARLARTGEKGLVEKVFSAKTAKDFEAAVGAVNQALGVYDGKVQAATASHEALEQKLNRVVTITPEIEAALQSAYDATTIDGYNAAMQTVLDLTDGQLLKQQQLDDTLRRYGLSWEELGPKARAAKLGELATGLVTDFNLLVGAGVNVNTTLAGMKPKLNEFIEAAKRTGTEVPESMRPLLQSAIDQGLLIDANGRKYQKLEEIGLTFGTTMERTMRGVETVLERLATVLEERFPAAVQTARNAIDTLPTERTFTVRGRFDPGDLPDSYADQLEGHAHGGVFTKEHIARIAEGGRPEIVGNVDFMTDALAGALQRVNGGGTADGDLVRNLSRELSAMRRDIREMGPSFYRAARDLVLLNVSGG